MASSPITIQIYVDSNKTPGIQYGEGPWRVYEFSSDFHGFKARLSAAGREPTVTLVGTLVWKDKDAGRATIAFSLQTAEPVIVELLGMHPDKRNASQAEAVVRQTFGAGKYDVSRDVWVILTYNPAGLPK